MRGFWRVWMTLWCGAVLVLGLVFVLAVAPGLDVAAKFYFEIQGHFDRDRTAFESPVMKESLGVLGAVLIGWALTALGMVRVAATGDARVWRWLTAAVATWYLVDTSLSIGNGYVVNAGLNSLILGAFLVPVLLAGVLADNSGNAST